MVEIQDGPTECFIEITTEDLTFVKVINLSSFANTFKSSFLYVLPQASYSLLSSTTTITNSTSHGTQDQ